MEQGARTMKGGARSVSVLAVLAAIAWPAAAHTADLQPHRAVYDLALANAGPSADMAAVTGRLVFDFAGAACEGYTVNSRFVTNITDREGNTLVTDLRSSTYETENPAEFEFFNAVVRGGGPAEEVRGRAEASASGLTVTRAEPVEDTLSLRRAVFPAAHTKLILEAAAAGERILEIPVFDAGDQADEVYDTTSIIGPRKDGAAGASDAELAVLEDAGARTDGPSWRVVITYFDAGQAGEATPSYELAFDLLESGIAYNVRFSYDAFVLDGALTELEVSEPPAC